MSQLQLWRFIQEFQAGSEFGISSTTSTWQILFMSHLTEIFRWNTGSLLLTEFKQRPTWSVPRWRPLGNTICCKTAYAVDVMDKSKEFEIWETSSISSGVQITFGNWWIHLFSPSTWLNRNIISKLLSTKTSFNR